MKVLKVLVLLSLFPFLLYSQTGPKLEVFGGEEIDAGTFIRNNEVHYMIRFKNTGDSDLIIQQVFTSCGCSTALATNDTIKTGDEGSINFTFNGHGSGQVMKNVMINTNETPNGNHTIVMKMNMVDPLTLDPAQIMTQGKVSEEIKLTATLLNSSDREVTLDGISANTPVITVTPDKTTINKGEAITFYISIKIYEDSPVNAAIIIKTSEGEYQLPVLVDIKAN